MRQLLLWVLLALVGAAGVGGVARAHSMPNSMLLATFEANDVGLEAILPWAELKYALPPSLAAPPASLTPEVRRELESYALAHIGASTAEGQPWAVRLESLAIDRNPDHADLHLRFRLRPPPGAPSASFVLRDDAVTHIVMSHVALVFARDGREKPEAEPRLVGMLQNPNRLLLVAPAAPKTSFGEAFQLGARHIAGGADHLLFLITLLLPAPLAGDNGRWVGRKPMRAAIISLLSIVTAFTIGHSLSLLLGAFLGLQVPQQPVEVAIALSILVAAIGAWRPFIFESASAPLVAGGFGVVHGLAFSAALAEHIRSSVSKLVVVAGFNLGIEAVQLAIVAVVAPALVLAARSDAYEWARRCGALLAGAAALFWIVQRVTGAA